MKYLKDFSIKLGDLESNESFYKDGGWVNGILTDGNIKFSVGGGWIHCKSSADHYNNCHGFSYSGGGPNPYKQALSAGGFESYRGEELGDIDEVYSHFGFNEGDNEAECAEIYQEIIQLNEQAWEDHDVSDSADWIALTYTDEEIIEELKEKIEDNDDDNLSAWLLAANLKNIEVELTEDNDGEHENDGMIYKVVERKLLLDSVEIASWTICAQGWYVDNKNNPNYSIGWNTEENTEGGDGINKSSTLYTALKELNLLEEAEELPEINEPEQEEESDSGEYIVEVRNTYTSSMEEWSERAKFETEKGAKFYVDNFWRKFYSENSSNSYGPEIRIMFNGEEIELED